MRILTGLTMLLMLLCGCRTLKVDWDSRVGVYTFDQVVTEMGPPDKQATLTDGTRVADWMTRRGGVRRIDLGPYCAYYPYAYGYGGYPPYVDYYVPDYFLRLTFDPEGVLEEWKKLAR